MYCLKFKVCLSAGSVWSKVDQDCQVGGQSFRSSGQELCQTAFQTQGETCLYFTTLLVLSSLFQVFCNQNAFLGTGLENRKNNKQTLSSSVYVLQAKSEPRAAAPSAGPVIHLQPPQPTSSHASALTNAVRIEKLSDEEDEEVDITDDLSDDGDGDDKPRAGLKTELCEPVQLAGAEIQADSPAEEQPEAGLTETKDQPGHTSLSPRSPQPSSSLPCSETTGVTVLHEKGNEGVFLPPKSFQAGAQVESEEVTGENEGQSSQSESSARTGQLEEACSDATGKTAVFIFKKDIPTFFSFEVTLWSYLPPRFS